MVVNNPTVSKKRSIVLKIQCCPCDGHKRMIRKAFRSIGCLDEFTIQPMEGTLTMSTSSREPDELISALVQYAKIKAELLSSCEEVDDDEGPPVEVNDDRLRTQNTVCSPQQLPICASNPPRHYLQSAKRSFHSEMETTTYTYVSQMPNRKQKMSFPMDVNVEITHPGHHHPLFFQHAPAPYDCHGCKEKGFRSCFKCNDDKCKFYLHDECAEAKPRAHHKFFKNCDLIFHKEAPEGQERHCDACGMVLRGFRYQCSHEKAHDFHPTCLKLPWVIENDEIKLELRDKVRSNCLLCGKKEILEGIKGWAYASTSSSGICYHISCLKEIIYENWKKAFLFSRGEPSYYEGSSRLSLVPSIDDDTQMVKHGKDSTQRSKASMLGKIAKVVLRFIIAVLTGDVSGLILAAIGI